MLPDFIENTSHNLESDTLCNRNIHVVVGHLLLTDGNNDPSKSLLTYLGLLYITIHFIIPYKVGINSCWKLMEISCKIN